MAKGSGKGLLMETRARALSHILPVKTDHDLGRREKPFVFCKQRVSPNGQISFLYSKPLFVMPLHLSLQCKKIFSSPFIGGAVLQILVSSGNFLSW